MSQPYDIIPVDHTRQFSVIFLDDQNMRIDVAQANIEIGYYCNNQYIPIINQPMYKVSTGEFTYETVILSNLYPVNQFFIVKYTAPDPASGDTLNKFENFRTVISPIKTNNNSVRIVVNPVTRGGNSFTNGSNF